MNLYALRYIKTRKLLGFDISSNGDDASCNATMIALSPYCDMPWVTTDLAEATRLVAGVSTSWYNSSISEPSSSFKAGELEIVVLSIQE